MVVTNDTTLPTEEELTVPEINLSSAALRAGAFHLGKYCEKQNLVSLTSICDHSKLTHCAQPLFIYFRLAFRLVLHSKIKLLCNLDIEP